MDFKKKYLKYKTKYLLSGGSEAMASTNKIEIRTISGKTYYININSDDNIDKLVKRIKETVDITNDIYFFILTNSTAVIYDNLKNYINKDFFESIISGVYTYPINFLAYALTDDEKDQIIKIENDNYDDVILLMPVLTNKDVVLYAINRNGYYFHYTSAEMKGDKDVVLAAINKNPNNIIYVSKEMRGDKDVVLAAINKIEKHSVPDTYKDASEELKNDSDVILAAVNKNAYTLGYVTPDINKYKDIVLAAVKQDGFSLQFASEEMRNDKEVVLVAVKQNGTALRVASEKMRNDKEVVLEAVKQDVTALQYASEEMKNKEVVLDAVKQYDTALQYASEEMKNTSFLQRMKNFTFF